jgi:hypothetical protein
MEGISMRSTTVKAVQRRVNETETCEQLFVVD